MWLPGLVKVAEWRMKRLRRRGVSRAGRAKVAAAYVRVRPDDPAGWGFWGNTLFLAGKYAEAEDVLRRGMELHPGINPDLGWVLASVGVRTGRSDRFGHAAHDEMRGIGKGDQWRAGSPAASAGAEASLTSCCLPFPSQ